MFLVMHSLGAVAQICDRDTIVEDTPTERFLFVGDGLAIDIKTGLLWDRCIVGQSYDPEEDKCVGASIEFDSVADLLSVVDELNANSYLGYTTWRVPNLKELGSIVERACVEPAINLDVFPSTSNVSFVSNTPARNGSDYEFRYINFRSGEEFSSAVNFQPRLRVVTDANQ
ncbi:MAG: adhesin [Oleiphilus sp.]|nr:MAG: adhesin [Oleiphilus sp.]